MGQLEDKPEGPRRGDQSLSADWLNHLADIILRHVSGVGDARVSYYGDRLVIEGGVRGQPQLPEFRLQTGDFVVLGEFDDYLLCTPFTQPFDGLKWTPQQWDAFLGSDALVKVYVAKPYDLQRSPWDGRNVHYDGWQVGISYTGLAARVVALTRDEDDTDHPLPPDHWRSGPSYVTPGYFRGDVISASRRTSGLVGPDGQPVAWVDENVAGRSWQSPGGAGDWDEEDATPGDDWDGPAGATRDTIWRVPGGVMTGMAAPGPIRETLLWSAGTLTLNNEDRASAAADRFHLEDGLSVSTTGKVYKDAPYVTDIASAPGVKVGTRVYGVGIPPGAVVEGILGGGMISISANATAGGDSVNTTGDTTASSATVTSLPATDGLVAGMKVVGDGIPVSATILSVDGPSQITLSTNATLTATGVTLWFLNDGSFRTGNTTSGGDQITGLPSTTGITVGMYVTGPGIPAATTVASIDSPSQITMSSNATATASGVTIWFIGGDVTQDSEFSDGTLTAAPDEWVWTFYDQAISRWRAVLLTYRQSIKVTQSGPPLGPYTCYTLDVDHTTGLYVTPLGDGTVQLGWANSTAIAVYNYDGSSYGDPNLTGELAFSNPSGIFFDPSGPHPTVYIDAGKVIAWQNYTEGTPFDNAKPIVLDDRTGIYGQHTADVLDQIVLVAAGVTQMGAVTARGTGVRQDFGGYKSFQDNLLVTAQVGPLGGGPPAALEVSSPGLDGDGHPVPALYCHGGEATITDGDTAYTQDVSSITVSGNYTPGSESRFNVRMPISTVDRGVLRFFTGYDDGTSPNQPFIACYTDGTLAVQRFLVQNPNSESDPTVWIEQNASPSSTAASIRLRVHGRTFSNGYDSAGGPGIDGTAGHGNTVAGGIVIDGGDPAWSGLITLPDGSVIHVDNGWITAVDPPTGTVGLTLTDGTIITSPVSQSDVFGPLGAPQSVFTPSKTPLALDPGNPDQVLYMAVSKNGYPLYDGTDWHYASGNVTLTVAAGIGDTVLITYITT